MRVDILTIFPELFDAFVEESIIGRAQRRGLLKIYVHNLRKWATDRHKTVDDKPFGGGTGMVMKVEPIYRAISQLQNKKLKTKYKRSRVILFTPRGKKFDQRMAYRFSRLDRLIMICGRYEGVDERVAKYIADEEVSVGDYVVMGGEVPAMIVVEAVARLIPGVLGKSHLVLGRVTKRKGFLEYPEYTRPEIFSPKKGVAWRVPKVLLSGDHKKIAEWREKHEREIV